MKGHICGLEEIRSAYRTLTGKPLKKYPLGRLIRRQAGYIKMDLMKTGCDYVTGSGLDPMAGFDINNTASKSSIATCYLGSPLKWG